jgi:CheY-like chemotaxis protein
MAEKEIWLAASPGRQRNYISRILGTRKDIEVIHLSSTVDVLKHSSVSQADALLLVADDQIASELIGKENLFASNVHKVLVSDRQDLNESPFWAEAWHSFSLARVKRLAIKDQNATFVPSKGRVLLVDDDELNRELLPNDLQYQIGLDASIIDTAASGQEAIEMMSGGEYAVVITDHQMPLMNGLDLAKYIKEQWRGVLVAVMTANASEHVKSEYAKIGVDICISKPPKQDQLQRLMESINTKKGLKSLSRAEQSFSSWPFVERRNKTKTEDHLRGVYEANLHNWLKDLSIHINAEERESALQVTHQAIGSSSIAGASDWVQFFSYIDELIRNDDWAGARLQMQRSGVLI